MQKAYLNLYYSKSYFYLLSLILFNGIRAKEINNLKDFKEFINQENRPIVIKFYTKSCPACNKIEPIFDKISKNFADSSYFGNVNLENKEFEKLADFYGVSAVPTFFFKKVGGEDLDGFTKKMEVFTGKKAQSKESKKISKKIKLVKQPKAGKSKQNRKINVD